MIGVPKILKLKQSDWLEKYIDLILVKERMLSIAMEKTFLS